MQSAAHSFAQRHGAMSLVTTRKNAIPSGLHAAAAAFEYHLSAWHRRNAGV